VRARLAASGIPRFSLSRRNLFLAALTLLLPRRTAAQTAAPDIYPLAAMTGVVLPPGPLELAIARVTLPPGADVPATTPDGVRMLAPEGGAAVAEIGATARDPVGGGGAVAPGAVTVADGSALAIDAATLGRVRNPAAQPLTLLDAAVFSQPERPLPPSLTTADGLHFRALARGAMADAPPSPADVSLLAIDLPAGSALPSAVTAGPALIRVERGAVAMQVLRGAAEVAVSVGWPSLSPVGEAEPAAAGATLALETGSAAWLPPGAAAAVANAGDGPARLLALLVRPAER